MKTGLALFFLIGLGLVFEIKPLWPASADYTVKDWGYIELTKEDTVKAIDNFRRNAFLDKVFYIKPFPFAEQKLSRKTHVYFIFAHVIAALTLLLWALDKKSDSTPYVAVYCFLMFGDLVDYLLRYNEDRGISYNVLFVIIYGMFLLTMQIWNQSKRN